MNKYKYTIAGIVLSLGFSLGSSLLFNLNPKQTIGFALLSSSFIVPMSYLTDNP